MAKRRRKLEIKMQAIPEAFMRQVSSCPVCNKDARAIGRQAMQLVFQCEHCRVVFKRVHASPLDRI